MSKRNKQDVTPPPKRVIQELFDFDKDGGTVPTVTQKNKEKQKEETTSVPEKTGPVKKQSKNRKDDEGEDVSPDDVADPSNDNGVAPPAERATAFVPGEGGPFARLIDSNFLEFASYTICDRAIPTVEDGLKPVQRRILHSLHEKDDGRFIKVANIVGHTMQYHPHGDASIGDALVNLATRGYLIEGQGNFGNIYTGDGAAAPRYIECRLTELARNEIFNKKTTSFIPSYDGRNKEPVLLPSKLPLLLMLGASGIAVGLATRIFPHNFIELLEAQISIISNKPFSILPDFQTGGLLDVSEYSDGVGRITTRARIVPKGTNTLAIKEIPYGETTESLIVSIEDAARRKKVPVKSIQDATAADVEIILTLTSGTSTEKAIQSLYAFTKCEQKITTQMVVLENNRPCERTVSEILKANTEQLINLLNQELEIRRRELEDEQHEKTLVQIFIEERIYKRIETCTEYDQIKAEIRSGFLPFKDRLYREITDDDIEKLLQVRIRRISLYDMNRNRDELEAIMAEMAEVDKNIASIKKYAINYLKSLIKKYKFIDIEVEETAKPDPETDSKKKGKGKKRSSKKTTSKTKKVTVERFPRRTEIATFSTIEVREITATKLTINYDPETGFLGGNIKTGKELFKCSPLDRIIVVWPDGKYNLIPAPEDRVFVDNNMLYAAIHDRDQLYTLVYTEKEIPFSCIKRFSFGGLIMNRDYNLLPVEGDIRIFAEGTPEQIWIKFKPAKGQRIGQKVFNPEEAVAVKGVRAKGKQITSKAIQYISDSDTPPRFWKDEDTTDRSKLI